MFGRFTSRFTVWCLKNARLSLEDRAFLTNHLLNKLAALPTCDIISVNETGALLIKGRSLSTEQIISLRESVEVLSKNYIRKVIREQVAFEAIKVGVHNSFSNETNFFAKTALWNQAKEQEILDNITKLLGVPQDE